MADARANRKDVIKQRTRRRFAFTGITLLCYFAFALNWTDAGAFLGKGVGDSMMTGGMLMFVILVVGFLVLEYIFIRGSGIGLSGKPDERD